MECEHHTGLHVFENQVILEVVDAEGQPVADGAPGAKILVTNLFNHVQPLIRYELTDLVTMAAGSCPSDTTPAASSRSGRTDDIIILTDHAGQQVPVHPNHFAEAIEATAGVHAYQVTQQEHAIDIAIVAPSREETDVSSAVTGAVARDLSRSTQLRHRCGSESSTRSADRHSVWQVQSCERAPASITRKSRQQQPSEGPPSRTTSAGNTYEGCHASIAARLPPRWISSTVSSLGRSRVA